MNESGKSFKEQYINWLRAIGPLLSVLFHVVLIVLLALFFKIDLTPHEEDEMVITMTDPPDFTPKNDMDLTPPDTPEAPDVTTSVDVPDINEPIDIPDTVDIDPGFEDVNDPFDSPLKIDLGGVLGRDQEALNRLKAGYGNRAAQNGLLGSYFNRIDFTGETFTRIDHTLNKQWGESSPWPNKINADHFSVIWTGRIAPKRSGRYTLYLQSDDGARLWINRQLVLNQFTEHESQWDTIELELLAGLSYDIKYVYCDVTVHAVSQLEWSCAEAEIPRQLIPVDCLWADSPSSSEMLSWNEKKGGAYPNRKHMPHPAKLDNQPFSHLVNYDKLSEHELLRLGLDDLVRDFRSYTRKAPLPELRYTLVKDVQPMQNDTEAFSQDDEIVITVL